MSPHPRDVGGEQQQPLVGGEPLEPRGLGEGGEEVVVDQGLGLVGLQVPRDEVTFLILGQLRLRPTDINLDDHDQPYFSTGAQCLTTRTH